MVFQVELLPYFMKSDEKNSKFMECGKILNYKIICCEFSLQWPGTGGSGIGDIIFFFFPVRFPRVLIISCESSYTRNLLHIKSIVS